MQETENKKQESRAADSRQIKDSARAESEAAGSGTTENGLPKDGTAESETVEAEAMKEVVVQDKARQKKKIFVAVAAALVLLLAVITGITTFGGSERKLQEQLELGAKYLEEMDYEQALVAFNAALEIEPKNVDAYLGIVEVYIRTNEFELALETAKEGYEVTGDEHLKEKIDMIESGDIFASNGWIMKMSGCDGEGNLIFWHEYTYNLKGQQASVAKYNAQGVQDQYLELTYDENGRPLISYDYWWNDSEAGLDKRVRVYSGNNWRETIYNGTGDEITGYVDVEADVEGKELKSTYYNADGSIGNIEVSEYNEAGNLIRQEYYDADNSLYGRYIYTYDKNGNCLQAQRYDADGTLLWYEEYIYDEGVTWRRGEATTATEPLHLYRCTSNRNWHLSFR